MGDMLMMTAILPCIKHCYNETKIDVVCGEWSAPILENNPYINNIFIINSYILNRKKISIFSKIAEFFSTSYKALKAININHYDLSIYARYSKGNLIPLHWFMKPTYSVGFGTRGRGVLLDLEADCSSIVHEADSFISLCKAISIENIGKLKCELYTTNDDQNSIKNIMKDNNIMSGEFVLIHLGSGDKNRLLDSRKWDNIIKKIDNSCKIVFTGLKNEQVLLDKLTINRENTIPLFGLLNVRQLYLLMCQAKMIYTVESLAAHLAGMTGVKTVSFYVYPSEKFSPLNAANVKIINVSELKQ
jgi:heptosyltransferase-2/heptosyltransferase-3